MKTHLIPEPTPLAPDPETECRPPLLPRPDPEREQQVACLRVSDEKAPAPEMPIRNFLRVVFAR